MYTVLPYLQLTEKKTGKHIKKSKKMTNGWWKNIQIRINKPWYIYHVNKTEGYLPIWNKTIRFCSCLLVLCVCVCVCVCICVNISVFMGDNSVHSSVSDFLMTLGVTKQVLGSWDLLSIPGRDTPAASRRSNQRWLTLREKKRLGPK